MLQDCQLILVLINDPLMSTPSLKREENDPWPVVQHGMLCVRVVLVLKKWVEVTPTWMLWTVRNYLLLYCSANYVTCWCSQHFLLHGAAMLSFHLHKQWYAIQHWWFSLCHHDGSDRVTSIRPTIKSVSLPTTSTEPSDLAASLIAVETIRASASD